MSNLQFGDVVVIKAKLNRGYRWNGQNHLKEWTRFTLKKPRTGILIGFRTLANGEVHYGQLDEPTRFIPCEHFRAALVALDAKTKPVLVRLEDVVNDIEQA